MVELEEAGERVQWPSGFDRSVAQAYIADYERSIAIARLYTYTEQHMEESIPVTEVPAPIPLGAEEPPQIVQAPLTLEAEPSEPGPLPLVSGNRRVSPRRNIPTLNVRPKRRCISLKEYQDRKST